MRLQAEILALRLWLPALLCVLSLLGCDSGKSDPEKEIREFLNAGEAAVEGRQLVAVANMISARYADPAGRSRKDLVRLVGGYLLGNRSVHLVTRIESIMVTSDTSAQVRVYAGLAGRAVDREAPLVDLRVDLYRFDLKLSREDGDWRLASAEWRRAEQNDLLEGLLR